MTELYNITIAREELSGDYIGAIYCKDSNEAGGLRGRVFHKVINEISRRLKAKEKERISFPLPKEEPSLIVLPNGK